MKKIIISVAITSIYFLMGSSLPAEAMEGTCSWHRGINCSSGPDWDGSTICNDGWRDSTESFYSAQMCSSYHYSCTTEERQQLNLKYNVKDRTKKVEEIADQILSIQISNTNDTSTLRNNTIEALRLQSLLYEAQMDFKFATNQSDDECYSLGEKHYYEQQAEFFKSLNQSNSQTQNTLQNTCPSNLIASGDKCVCADGYVYNGNSCITYTQNCQAQFGLNSNSNGEKDKCYCSNEYTWNSNQTACDKIETPTTQTSQQQINQPKPASPVVQIRSPQSKIEPVPVIKKTFITATSTKIDRLATSSIKTEEIKQKTSPTKIKIFSKVKSFFSKIKFW